MKPKQPSSRAIPALSCLACLMESRLPGASLLLAFDEEKSPGCGPRARRISHQQAVSLENVCLRTSHAISRAYCSFCALSHSWLSLFFPLIYSAHFPFLWHAQFPSFSVFNTLTARSNCLCGTAVLDLTPHLKRFMTSFCVANISQNYPGRTEKRRCLVSSSGV